MIKVNGEIIPDEAVEFELSRLVRFYAEHMNEAQIREQIEPLKKRAVDQAIGAKLLILDAARMDITVTDEEVDAQLRQVVESAGGQESFEKAIEAQGLTQEAVKDNIREGRKVDHLVEKITEGVSDPTEDEMKAHYEAHIEEYTKPERAQGQHILITPKSDSNDDKEEAWQKLEGIRKEVEDGGDFAKLAEEHSNCPSGKQAGGSLGWFSRGMMVPEFDNAVFSMEVGALSDIIETQFGYHIVHKTGYEESQKSSYDEVVENIREFLRHVKRGEVLSAHVTELKEKAVIEIDDDPTPGPVTLK